MSLDCARVRQHVRLHVLARRLRARLCSAKHDLLRQRLEDLPHTAPAGQVLRTVHRFHGPTNPKKVKRRPSPMLRKENGNICRTSREVRDRWIAFFGDMEGAVRLPPDALREQWIENLQHFQQSEFDLLLSDLPNLCDLERSFAQVTVGKAVGMDILPPELCKRQASGMAKATFALLLKMLLHGQEALPHKGGRLTAAYKGKGAMDECSSYRSLLVSSQIGKCLHKTIRCSQSTFYERYLQHQQLGGRKGVPVTLGMHQLRSFLRVQQRRGRSCSILFLDLKEAFYRVLRPLALHSSWTDQDIVQVAQRLGLPRAALDDLYAHLQDPCALQQAELPFFLRNSITAIHTDTWFVVDGQDEDLCRTTAGSRPGDCFADTVFGYLWSRVLRGLEEQCIAMGLLEAFPEVENFNPFAPALPEDAASRHFLGPCWMDDLAIPLAGDTPSALISKTGLLAGLLLDRCISFAMTPNLSVGKTELLLSLRGAGSRSLRQRFLGAHGGRLFPVVGEHGSYNIKVITRYRHLGGIIHHQGDQRQEARQRVAVAHQTFTQQRRLLFGNQALPLQTRTQLFDSLISSALTYGSESWVLCTLKDKNHVHVSITKLYKRLLKVKPDEKLTDEEIYQRLGLPTPTDLLRRARLRYLGTLVRCRDSAEWGLLSADTAWIDLLCDDLLWMWRQLRTSTKLEDPREHFPQWAYMIQFHPGYWKRLIRRASHHAIQQTANRSLTAGVHRRAFDTLMRFGTLGVPAPLYQKDICVSEVFGCMSCALACRSKGGEGVHFFRKHGVIAPVRRLFESTWCSCCQKEFHTLMKMQLHLRNSGRCRRDLWARGCLYAPAPGIGSLQSQDQTRHHDGALPPQRTQGPAMSPVLPRDLEEERTDLLLALVDAVIDRAPEDRLEDVLRNTICSCAISWTSCRRTLLTSAEHLDVRVGRGYEG